MSKEETPKAETKAAPKEDPNEGRPVTWMPADHLSDPLPEGVTPDANGNVAVYADGGGVVVPQPERPKVEE